MAKLNPAAISDRARKMLEAKLESVSSLIAARDALAEARQQVADAEKDEARAYADTLAAGWSATDSSSWACLHRRRSGAPAAHLLLLAPMTRRRHD